MLFLGLLGILQIAALPGYLLLRLLKISPDNGPERLAYNFGASLIVNHWIVCALVAMNANGRAAWAAILCIELALLVYLWREHGFRSSSTFRIYPGHPLAIAAVVTLLVFAYLFYLNWGTVFSLNDDVASWDRWAIEWAHNQWPTITKLYPQLIPANWSITYALLGTTDVKLFAKATMPLFPIATMLLFLGLAQRRKNASYLAGASLYGALLLYYFGPEFIGSGYVDIPLAFFAFLSFYPLYRRPSAQDKFLAALFAGGAALAKQGGLYVTVAVAVYLIYSLVREREDRPTKSAWIALLSILLWYGGKMLQIFHGEETSHIAYLTGDIHAGRNFWQRIVFACRMLMEHGGRTGPFVAGFFAIFTAAGLFFRRTRFITLALVLPFFFSWAIFFSYEIRTASMLFPFVALVCSLTIPWPSFPYSKPTITGKLYWPAIGAAVIVLVAGLSVTATYSGPAILQRQLALERNVGLPQVNGKLYQSHVDRPVLTNYWYLQALPDLKQWTRFLQCGHPCSTQEVAAHITQNSELGYLLVQEAFLLPETAQGLGTCSGLETMFVEGTVRLFKIDRGAPLCGPKIPPAPPVIESLFPALTSAGAGFNVQPNGDSAIAIACRNATPATVVLWNGEKLVTVFGNNRSISALVPKQRISAPGVVKIELLDSQTGVRSDAVEFTVASGTPR
jgi:hypothetical protein